MPLTDDQEQSVRLMLSELDSDASRKAMNPWELGFVADQIKRYDEWGSQMNLSPKQWKALEKIYNKVMGHEE